MERHFEVIIVGGGTGGISTAARLRDAPSPPEVAIIEPSAHHYYQPIWTLVGAGVFPREISARPEADLIPEGATWIRDRVDGFEPDVNAVITAKGDRLTYDHLVVAAGIQLDWSEIEGLPECLNHGGVCSNYSYGTVGYTWETISSFTGGNAVFTFPVGAIKCAGAPQKIMYLAEHAFRRAGIRDRARVIYGSATPTIFGVAKYRKALEKILAERDIETLFRHNLVAVRADEKKAIFEHLDTGERIVVDYEMLHVTPPQSVPDFLAQSPLAGEHGWVDVHQYTLRHNRYPNVFALGDCSSLPNSKTGAAIRSQAPVLVENLLSVRAGRAPTARYDGYASCPLVTAYGKMMLAEFGYDGKIMETFPFDQAQERYSMYLLKAYGLPAMYWNGMLKGRM